MTRSLAERLRHAAPPPSVAAIPVQTTISDIERILALPERPPVDCERDPATGLFPPLTQALIEIMTERFTRGPRVSCACRERHVRKLTDGSLLISRAVLLAEEIPEPPKVVSFDALVRDAQPWNSADGAAVAALRALPIGGEVTLPSADGRNHACIDTFNPVQAWLLREGALYGGVVGFCGVGSGKSIAFIIAALLFSDIRLAVLCFEPKQRRHYRSQYVRAREHFKVPSIVFDDGNPGYTVPGTPPLHLISYSVISQTKNSDLLDARDPDALFLDEAHRACGESAINRRVKRFCAERIVTREQKIARGEPVPRRATYLLDASGTMEPKSVADTQMLCAYSLGTGSPAPLDPEEAKRWSGVMDPQYQPDRGSKTAKMLQRVFAGREYDDESIMNLIGAGPEKAIREGFRKRRLWTPGIVSASASSINASIYFTERKAPKMPQTVYDALIKVRTEGLRPDDEVLVEHVEKVACARNVACGFYNYWAFPNHRCECSPVTPRCGSCLHIDDWYAKRKAYNKELRSKLIHGAKFLDSQELCWDAAERFYQNPPYKGALPVWDSLTFPQWRDIEDTVQYEKRETWLDGGDYLVNDAAAWMSDNKGVVWLQSTAFGHKLSKLTKLPFYNGGPKAEEKMAAEKGNRSIIVSIKAHGAGTDGLQEIYNHQLIVETPASNAKQSGYEQLLGRLHREGQRKDEVFVEGYFHVREMKDAFRQALAQAEFNFEMQKNRQKLRMADLNMDWL